MDFDLTKIVIQKASKENYLEWLILRHALWPQCTQLKHKLEIEEYLSLDKKTAFLARPANMPAIGMLEVSIRDKTDGCPENKVGYLEGLYVTPLYRRYGKAKRLILVAEEWCKDEGCLYIASDTAADNISSLNLHEKMGYHITSNIIFLLKKL